MPGNQHVVISNNKPTVTNSKMLLWLSPLLLVLLHWSLVLLHSKATGKPRCVKTPGWEIWMVMVYYNWVKSLLYYTVHKSRLMPTASTVHWTLMKDKWHGQEFPTHALSSSRNIHRRAKTCIFQKSFIRSRGFLGRKTAKKCKKRREKDLLNVKRLKYALNATGNAK